MRIDTSRSSSGSPDRRHRWPDLADLLDDIRSPQREEVTHAVATAMGERFAPETASRIADAVMALYHRRHATTRSTP